MSTHNYDCLNAGVWFARASGRTAAFFLVLLEYLYEHWYEGDQRSFNSLATGNVSVSFQDEVRRWLPQPALVVGRDVYPRSVVTSILRRVGVGTARPALQKERREVVARGELGDRLGELTHAYLFVALGRFKHPGRAGGGPNQD